VKGEEKRGGEESVGDGKEKERRGGRRRIRECPLL